MTEYIVLVHVHYAAKGLVRVARSVDGMVQGRWIHLKHIPLLRTMGYLYRHNARYQFYQENEHILCYTLRKDTV